MDKTAERIQRMRMHNLYLSRQCGDICELSRELMGLHCWFHRNVAFSALIRGASLAGWKNALTKTWLYRGTLHGVVFDELPLLLALHAGESYTAKYYGEGLVRDMCEQVISLMEDGIFSRAEMRKHFAQDLDQRTIEAMFSPWGGVFVHLAGSGKVAFRDMTSRDFDLISAEPTMTQDEVLPELLRRYLSAYGPARLADAAWFLGLWKEGKKKLEKLDLSEYRRIEYEKDTYYYTVEANDMADIPELTLLSGFDPLIVSYTERAAVLPKEFKNAVILKSGICLPTVAVNGQIAAVWNIKKNQPVLDFLSEQPRRIKDEAHSRVEGIIAGTAGMM